MTVMLAAMRHVGTALVVVHVAVGGWALAGMVELAKPNPLWPALSNPALPPALLLVHWSLMLLTAGTFLVGYLRQWQGTPAATAASYIALASLCAVETFGFLQQPAWYAAMAAEYATYAAILLVLFRTSFRHRFARRPAETLQTVPTVRSER